MPPLSTNAVIILQINPNSTISEAYRSLLFNIEFSANERKVKTIAITSSLRGEGKTTTAINLATAYAQIGKKVILLDADLRKPSIHLVFGEDNSKGLSNLLAKQTDITNFIKKSPIENLSIITAGPIPNNPSELLASKQMDSLLEELKQNYDIILFDTSPALSLIDAKIIAAKCDGTLLVVKFGKVKRNIAKKVQKELVLAKVNLLGVVWNKVNSRDAEVHLFK